MRWRMKSILMSIKPEWLVKILNGEKTVEIRKSCPKDIPKDGIDVYLYCTQAIPVLYYDDFLSKEQLHSDKYIFMSGESCNGLVVVKFRLNKADIITEDGGFADKTIIGNLSKCQKELLKKACLNEQEYLEYVGKSQWMPSGCNERIYYSKGYAWHIEKLEILNEQMELREFSCRKSLERPPQSWQYVEVKRCQLSQRIKNYIQATGNK